MKINVQQLSQRLADENTISDRDVVRAMERIEKQLSSIQMEGAAIPMQILYARAILRRVEELRRFEQDMQGEQPVV